MIRVSNDIPIYEIDGREVATMNKVRPDLTIQSHWNEERFVVLLAKVEGREQPLKLTVLAQDLEAAVRNATNKGAR